MADFLMAPINDRAQHHVNKAEAASAWALIETGNQAFFSVRGVIYKNDFKCSKGFLDGLKISDVLRVLGVFGTKYFIGHRPSEEYLVPLQVLKELDRILVMLIPFVG